jgi:hypothetical protein
MLYPLEKPTSWSTHLYSELSYAITGIEELHASLLLKVFRSESRDEILLRGEGCNTPGVYRWLDH